MPRILAIIFAPLLGAALLNGYYEDTSNWGLLAATMLCLLFAAMWAVLGLRGRG